MERNLSIPVPEYMKIRQYVIGIIAGAGGEPKKILPERKLCEIYGVARGTVRKALGDLVREEYLIPKRGMGTFINPRRGASYRKDWVKIGIILNSGMTVNLNEALMGALSGALKVFAGRPGLYTQIINFAHENPVSAYKEIEPLNLDGLLWLYPSAVGRHIAGVDYFFSRKLPLVAVSTYDMRNWKSSVIDDYQGAVQTGVVHLLKNGHRDVVYVGKMAADSETPETAQVYAAFNDGFLKQKLTHAEEFSLGQDGFADKLFTILSSGRCSAVYTQGGEWRNKVIDLLTARASDLPVGIDLLCSCYPAINKLDNKFRLNKIMPRDEIKLGETGANALCDIVFNNQSVVNRRVSRDFVPASKIQPTTEG